MLTALIFDVDGTLADTESAHRAAFNHAFAEEGLDVCMNLKPRLTKAWSMTDW